MTNDDKKYVNLCETTRSINSSLKPNGKKRQKKYTCRCIILINILTSLNIYLVQHIK